MSWQQLRDRATWDTRICSCQWPFIVYRIRHPQTREIRYVGCTGESLVMRLSSHLRVANGPTEQAAQPLYQWMRELAMDGLRPVIEEISLVPWAAAADVEDVEITRHREAGHPLLNGVRRRYPRPHRLPTDYCAFLDRAGPSQRTSMV